jgi:hypothetical protein
MLLFIYISVPVHNISYVFVCMYINKYIYIYPIPGDTDGDGVLSFEEFKDIFREVAPDWHERRIMCIFREALMMGKDNDDTIGPQVNLMTILLCTFMNKLIHLSVYLCTSVSIFLYIHLL